VRPLRGAIVVFALVSLTGCDVARNSKERRQTVRPIAASTDCRDWVADWRWTCRIVQHAGFRIIGHTGSSLTVEGHGAGFNIWTTRLRRPIEAVAGHSEPVARVRGISVFGDRTQWRYWAAQGFVFWLHAGPRRDSMLPQRRGLARLVAASGRVRRSG
jgi:hypothetical protein